MDRIGIYLRISDDRDGDQTATQRQEADCRRFAEGKGWEVVDVFSDVDLSAYKRATKRPEFERMLAAVRGKEIDGVLAWKIDRITRRQRDLVRLDEACEDAGGFIATVTEGIDTREPTGRFVAELLVSQARMESQNTSLRVTRKHEERARKGLPNNGGTRAFGYNAMRTEVIVIEAELIKDAASRVLAGESIRGICADWGAQGIVSTAGNPWQPRSLKRMLMSPTLSAQRMSGGKLVPGVWPEILTPEQTTRLSATLTDPRRGNSRPPRSYLLSGLLRCGRCGERLASSPKGDKKRRYACARVPGRANCGRLARLAEPVEETVKEMVIAALDGVDLAAYMDDAPGDDASDLVTAIRADEEALEELSRDFYAESRITRAEFFAARDPITARVEDNRRRLARLSGTTALTGLAGAGEEVRERWGEATLDWKRAVISAVIDHIVIAPAVPGRHKFDPSLVRPMWRF